METARRVRPDRGSLLGWLLAVTHHKSVDVIRSRQRRSAREAAAGRDPRSTPTAGLSAADEIIRTEASRRVAAALAELPAVVEEVLTLAYFHDLSQTQIAAVTGTPLGTVKSRSLNGKRQLARLLADLHPHADEHRPIPAQRSRHPVIAPGRVR